MSRVLPDTALARGFYPERQAPDETGLDRALITAAGHLRQVHLLRKYRFRRLVREVNRYGRQLRGLSEDELAWKAQALRPLLRSRGFEFELVAQAFALVREVSACTLGMTHFDVQLKGGWALLRGNVTEMRTGEGKTLVATLPACTLALAGVPVHIITVNDYLAERDASWMGPIYEGMGLSVASVVQGMEPEERRRAYASDVTYCTNKEIVFDYLRDRLQLSRRPGQIELRTARLCGGAQGINRLRLRGLYFAIVDEADSVLIDEARTPLIISGPGDSTYEAQFYGQALKLANGLESGLDYYIDFDKRSVELQDAGIERLVERARPLGGFWNGRLRREEIVRQALTALHLFHRDKHYVVRDRKVQIVDEYTGRIMPSRSWERGLHQLIETKEGCDVTPQTEVLGRISYQRFFRRYLALAGMTGTAREAAREMWTVYRRDVVTIPPNKPSRLTGGATHIYATADEKWSAVVRRIKELSSRDRPVLVGTRTVAASKHLHKLLKQAQVSCRVLNALQDEHEAEIVAEAGQRGRITVATNMAGRGTDIVLGEGVAALGGLHVIATERHDAGRIDRQLFGRSGRQGDPGSYETFLSLEDELLRSHPARVLGLLGPDRTPVRGPIGRLLARRLFQKSQRVAERKHSRVRRDLLRLDENVERSLAFSGRGE